MNDTTTPPADVPATTSPSESPLPANAVPPVVPTPLDATPVAADASGKPHHPILSGMVVILEGMARQVEKEFGEIADAIRVVIAKIEAHIKK